MKAYKIIGKTNSWIAQRDSLFKGKTSITLESGLTLREAQKKLLEFFNEDYEKSYKNWGLAVANSYVAYSSNDGTRGYEYDSRHYSIEEDDIYRVDDTESGNVVIYEGSDIKEAIDTILSDEDTDRWDLIKNGERVWCGKIDTINELNRLN